jgi:hypothetical protein
MSFLSQLPDEHRQRFEAIAAGWRAEFVPEGYQETRLVDILIQNDWLLQQSEQRLLEAEAALCNGSGDGQDIEGKQRQKAGAERSFYRAWNALQGLRKELMQYELKLAKAEREIARLQAKLGKQDESQEPQGKARTEKKKAAAVQHETKAQRLFHGQNAPKKLRKIQVLEQWVEVDVEDGMTKTTLLPSNEELIEVGKTMDPPPEYVYRRFHFLNGVPQEYAWAGGTADIRERGGAGVQRMLVDTWLDVIEREKERGDGHIGPCGGNLPRPKERGGCDCEVCTKNAAILERGV